MTSPSRLLAAALATPLLICSAGAAVVDDFNDESLSEYTLTRVLDNNTTSNISFSATGGFLSVSAASVTNVPEQVLLLRSDSSLSVGETLLLDTTISSTLGTAGIVNDFGLAISTTATPTGVASGASGDTRSSNSFLFITVRPGQDTVRAGYANNASPVTSFNSATAESLVAQLFITRTATNSFEVGYITTSATEVTLDLNGAAEGNAFTFTSSSMGAAIGFYADLRDTQTVSFADNLQIVPEPSALLLSACGLPFLLRRRRKA